MRSKARARDLARRGLRQWLRHQFRGMRRDGSERRFRTGHRHQTGSRAQRGEPRHGGRPRLRRAIPRLPAHVRTCLCSNRCGRGAKQCAILSGVTSASWMRSSFSYIDGGDPMGAIARSPIRLQAGGIAWQTLGAVNVTVASARTYSPGGVPLSPDSPDGISTATTFANGNERVDLENGVERRALRGSVQARCREPRRPPASPAASPDRNRDTPARRTHAAS